MQGLASLNSQQQAWSSNTEQKNHPSDQIPHSDLSAVEPAISFLGRTWLPFLHMHKEKCFQQEYLILPYFNRCFAIFLHPSCQLLLLVTIPLRLAAITYRRRRNILKTILLPLDYWPELVFLPSVGAVLPLLQKHLLKSHNKWKTTSSTILGISSAVTHTNGTVW